MDGPLVSTIASVSVRDGGYLLLLVVAIVGLSCVEGEPADDKTSGGEARKGRKEGGLAREREREEGVR